MEKGYYVGSITKTALVGPKVHNIQRDLYFKMEGDSPFSSTIRVQHMRGVLFLQTPASRQGLEFGTEARLPTGLPEAPP